MEETPGRHGNADAAAGAAAEPYTLERFQPLLGETFTLSDGTGSLAVTLIEASSLREAQGAGMRSQQFSLVWRGPPGAVLAQKIYTVSHPALGALELFLVTLGADAEGTRYEAVFT